MTDFFVDASLALAPVPEYELAFDVKSNVEAACSGAEQFERLASDYGLTSYYDKQAFLEEMRSVKVVMDVLDRKVDRLVNNSPQMLFRHLPLRDFWLDSFGTTQVPRPIQPQSISQSNPQSNSQSNLTHFLLLWYHTDRRR